MKRAVAIVLGVFLLLSLLLTVASEFGEVAVIRSVSGGAALETRIWVIDVPDGLLVRGTEGKAWVAGARQAAEVELERDGVRRRYAVIEQTGADARHRINEGMREKYGLADRLIGLLRDYDSTVSLLLTEIEPQEPVASAAFAEAPAPAEAPSISASALNERREAGDAPVVIDVRTPEEFASGHVPGAINIPFDQVAMRIAEVDAPNGVALYCMIGPRARKGEAALLASGYGDVLHLEGGLAAWEAAGLPVTSVEQPTGSVEQPTGSVEQPTGSAE